MCAKSRKSEAECIPGTAIVRAFVGHSNQRGRPGRKAGAVSQSLRCLLYDGDLDYVTNIWGNNEEF